MSTILASPAAPESSTESDLESWKSEKSQMLEILNEKTRESSQLKAENGNLIQNAAEEKAKADVAVAELENHKVRVLACPFFPAPKFQAPRL